MLELQGYESDGNTPPNPASGGNGISSSGWLFTVCLNDYCPILEGYAPAMGGNGISTWFQQLWKVSAPLPLSGCLPDLPAAFQGNVCFDKLQSLLQDPEWVEACADRFAALRAGPWSNATISGKIGALQGLLGEAAERTLTRRRSFPT